MRRRDLLASLVAAAGPLPALAQTATPRSIRITAVDVIVTNPGGGAMSNYVLVKVTTNQAGLHGWGDATCTGSELGVAKFLEEHLAPALIGRNPLRLEELWQTLFFLPYYRSGSVHMSAVSGLDMALWDIKGKVAGLPVHDLLGGKVREGLLTYVHASGRDAGETVENAMRFRAEGYKVIRVQVATPGIDGGYGVAKTGAVEKTTQAAYDKGTAPVERWDPAAYCRTVPKLFEQLRAKMGFDIEFLHDTHERIHPHQAVQLAKDLEPYKLFFLEDPLRPEHLDSFRLIRQQTSTPIAMGEVYVDPWQGLNLITEHLIDYVRHDLVHCGGITTGKKVATVCEPYGILTAWHGPSNISPVAHMANCHLGFSTINFGVQESSHTWAAPVKEVFSAFPVAKAGLLTINDAPGLGIEVNEAVARKWPYQRRLRPAITLPDGTPWPY